MKKSKKYSLLVSTIAIIFMCSYVLSFATLSDDIQDKKQEISDGKQKANEISEDIDSLNESINSIQNEIDTIMGKINGTKIEIAEVQAELNDIQKDIDSQSDSLNKRLRSMYMNDNVSFIDVILNSGSISELMTNLELIKRIHKGDKALLEEMEEQQAKIQEKQDELKALEESLQSDKASCESKQSALEADKSALNKKRAAIKAETAEDEEELAEMEAEAARITAQLSGRKSSGTYSGGMIWPCSGPITSEYGYRYCPYHGYELHSGIDISVSTGTPVKAASSGVVIQAYYNASYGNMVLLDNGSGICTLYAHNSKLKVSVGQKVSQGQVIALAGSTGNSTGPHCHFEVRLNGQPVNPRNYL